MASFSLIPVGHYRVLLIFLLYVDISGYDWIKPDINY